MPHTSVEMELLACCVKAFINPGKDVGQRINNTLKEEIDWQHFLYCAYTNRVVQIAYQGIKAVGINLFPQAIVLSMKDYHDKKKAHYSISIHELKRLLTVFREQNIPFIVYKGLALALLYSDINFREWSDLDIIVRVEDVHKVKDLLLSNGYRDHHYFQFQDQFPNKHSCPFIKYGGIIIVDVHWALYDSEDNLSFPIAPMWARYHTDSLLGIKIPVPSPEDLILSVCAHHGIRNHWHELKYICDIAMLVKVYGNISWESVIQEGKKLRMKRALLTGIILANELFQLILPHEIALAIGNDKLSKKAASLINKKLFNKINEQNQNGCSWLISFFFKESLYSRIILCKRYLRSQCHINENDKKLIYFPHYLHFLHYLIKPFRLLIKYKRVVSQKY